MTDRFEILLSELGKIFEMTLHVDSLGACSILIPPHPIVMLQLDETQEFLFLFSKILEIPPGKFRENVLCEALKANALPDPRPGILGYLSMTNTLTLHQKFPTELLNGERLASMISSLLDMAALWKQALQQGRAGPQIESPPLKGLLP